MWLIVGLGNPGSQYHWTPHNLGFHAVDHLATRWPDQSSPPMVERRLTDYFRRLDTERAASRGHFMSRAWTVKRLIDGHEVMLAKPMTFMNESGRSVRDLLWKLQLPTSSLIVVLDEVALPWGYVRIRQRGSAGGHKGLASIMMALESEEFVRVRMGAGFEDKDLNLTNYVLQPVPKRLHGFVEDFSAKTAEVVESIVRDGVQWAMTMFNKRVPLASWDQ